MSEWNPKKRLTMQRPARAPSRRRNPSHIKTQANDPGFRHIASVCKRAVDGLTEDDLDQRADAFRREMLNFAEGELSLIHI